MPAKSTPMAYQIKITLMEVQPPIWRRVLVPSNLKLDKIHDLLQIVMGWDDSHLHQFTANKQFYGIPDPFFPEDIIKESGVDLRTLLPKKNSTAVYEYDFGDSWSHKLVLEKGLPIDEAQPLPRCIEGEGACPPEDCGGAIGYEYLLAVMNDVEDPEYAEMLEWLGDSFDPAAFDLSAVNVELGKHFR